MKRAYKLDVNEEIATLPEPSAKLFAVLPDLLLGRQSLPFLEVLSDKNPFDEATTLVVVAHSPAFHDGVDLSIHTNYSDGSTKPYEVEPGATSIRTRATPRLESKHRRYFPVYPGEYALNEHNMVPPVVVAS